MSCDSPSAAFAAVRRACEDRSAELRNESGIAFRLPWWSFLACREAVGLVLREYGEGLEFDDEARRQVIAANQREAEFRVALPTTQGIAVDLETRLESLGFRRRLTPEQLRNVSRLIRLPAAAGFSVPGAGKTTEALAFYFLRSRGDSQLFVVAPKNAFAAWEEQLADCVPTRAGEFVRLVGGVDNIAEILISQPRFTLITYHQLPNVLSLAAQHIERKQTCMVLDESHRMKRGVEGVHGRSLLSISHLPSSKIILSGTPIPNSLADLVPQFDFLYPEVRASEEEVKHLIQPVYARTTKAELRLDPPIVRKIPIPMTPAQSRIYELLKSETARELADLSSSDRIAIRKIGRSVMRLLQLASNPALLTQAAFDRPELVQEMLAEGGSPKLEWVCNRVRTLASEGHKSVVWSGFVDNVEILAERLHDLGAVYIHGGVEASSDEDADTREHRIRRFHEDPRTIVLVANPAACGEGISLHTVCHHAIYMDRNYNAAQFLQSQDRIHRLGLLPGTETTIEIAYSPGTVDESVDRRLNDKVALMAGVLNDRSLNIEPVTVDPDDLTMNNKDIEDFQRHLKE